MGENVDLGAWAKWPSYVPLRALTRASKSDHGWLVSLHVPYRDSALSDSLNLR